MKTISIRQPGYLPYLGFFKKIQSVDEFIFLNDVQYSRGDWDNRNKIRTTEGSLWLTVPILNNSKKINSNDFALGLKKIKPSITQEINQWYDTLKNEVSNIIPKSTDKTFYG